MTDTHSSNNLREIVISILHQYEIDINDVLSCTTDNAANMLKMSCLLHQDQNDCDSECCENSEDEPEFNDEDESIGDFSDSDEQENSLIENSENEKPTEEPLNGLLTLPSTLKKALSTF